MEQDIEKENERLRDLLYSKIMFIEQLKEDYRKLVKDIEEITNNYNEARDLAIKFKAENARLKSCLQEIKAIAKTGMHCEGMGCDFMPKILDLITKAEEE